MPNAELTRFCKTAASSRLMRTLAAGVIALVVQAAVFETLGIYLRIFSPSTAVLISAEFGVLTSFYLNNRFSFHDRREHVPLVSRLIRFHIVVSGSVMLQWLFVFVMEQRTSSYLLIHAAFAAGIVVGFIWNYTLYHFFVWRKDNRDKAVYYP